MNSIYPFFRCTRGKLFPWNSPRKAGAGSRDVPSTKPQRAAPAGHHIARAIVWSLRFGASLELGAWDLGFGALLRAAFHRKERGTRDMSLPPLVDKPFGQCELLLFGEPAKRLIQIEEFTLQLGMICFIQNRFELRSWAQSKCDEVSPHKDR